MEIEEDFVHLFDDEKHGYVVDHENLKLMIDEGLVPTDSYVNCRPGGDAILSHLANFEFAKAVIEYDSITEVFGKIPKDITKDELKLWFNNVLFDLSTADEQEFDNDTGEFRFWWD